MANKLNNGKDEEKVHDFAATKAELEAVLNTHFARDEKGCLPNQAWCDSISRCIHKKKSVCPEIDDIVRYRMFSNDEEFMIFNKVVFSPTIASVEDDATIKIEDIITGKV
jgi:hypothetical protein